MCDNHWGDVRTKIVLRAEPEPDPLVRGGQGRSGEDIERSSSGLLMCLLVAIPLGIALWILGSLAVWSMMP